MPVKFILAKYLPLWLIFQSFGSADAAQLQERRVEGLHGLNDAQLVLEPKQNDQSEIEEQTQVTKDARFRFDSHKLWANPKMEIIGLSLMFILIALSNAGGLSGAGSNIPLMLIFFDMNMDQAVPVSSFVAVCATLFRFLLNFSKSHPRLPERNLINYEIVEVTMPFVFLGSFIGVFIGKLIGSDWQATIFCITVAWSIVTTAQKYCKLLEKERNEEQKQLESERLQDNDNARVPVAYTGLNDPDPDEQTNLLQKNGRDSDVQEANAEEIADMCYQEKYHFTCRRVSLILLMFLVLLGTQITYKSPDVSQQYKAITVGTFAAVCIFVTICTASRVKRYHEIKADRPDLVDSEDIPFNDSCDVFKMALVCMVAAILCGCTGIAGGMVLGPLFMAYGMNPQVMAATNQYITMVSAVSVALQFAMMNDMIWPYAGIFGFSTIIAAFLGIKAVECYIQKSGKESIIALLLIIVLVIALISIPIKHFLIHKPQHVQHLAGVKRSTVFDAHHLAAGWKNIH